MMKTAVSIPNEIFAEAERVAEKSGMSRSQLYAEALRTYLDVTRDERITQELNAVYDSQEYVEDAFLKKAARKVFADTKS